VCEAQNKPLVLFYLVCTRGVRSGALVFTKSTESAIRLVQLFEYFFANSGVTKILADGMNVDGAINHVPVVRAYSSDLPAGERKAILEKFKAHEVDM
jgi:ATP-dependent RNA helicase DDX51/DBP6